MPRCSRSARCSASSSFSPRRTPAVGARVARAARRPNRAGVARWETKVGAPTGVALGTHFALDRPRSPRGFAPRQAIAVGAIAIAIVAAIAMLLGSVDRLYTTPAEHGWPWDVAIGNSNFTITDRVASKLQDDPAVSAATVVRYGQAQIDGRDSYVLAVDPVAPRRPMPSPGDSRKRRTRSRSAPRQLRALHKHIGDTVTLSVAGGDFESDAHRPRRRAAHDRRYGRRADSSVTAILATCPSSR